MVHWSPAEFEEKYGWLIKDHPNTYTLTKRLAEVLLSREHGTVPLAIVRPGIILNTWREPFPGWVENVNSGHCGFIAGASKGIFCTFQGRPDNIMDVIPVDLVVSTILAAALKAEREPKQLHVLHSTSGTVNHVTWGEFCDSVIRAAREHPCERPAWYPRAKLRINRHRNNLVMFIFQVIPSYFIDLFAVVTKPSHVLMDLQRRFIKGNKYTSYFSLREWYFERDVVDKVVESLSEEDRTTHPIDPRLIKWNTYFELCVLGTRKYFHKESSGKTTPTARLQMRVLRVIAAIAPVLSFTVICCLAFLIGVPWIPATALAAFTVLLLIWL